MPVSCAIKSAIRQFSELRLTRRDGFVPSTDAEETDVMPDMSIGIGIDMRASPPSTISSPLVLPPPFSTTPRNMKVGSRHDYGKFEVNEQEQANVDIAGT
jgi:hypothetical protein